MSDLFHPDVPFAFIERVFTVMEDTPRHTYQVLTKRSKRLTEIAGDFRGPRTCGSAFQSRVSATRSRADHLRCVSAAVRFLSIEPLIGPVEVGLDGIDWVMVGGESGPHARSADPQWVRKVRDDCVTLSVPFFFKQWGGRTPKSGGRLLDGITWDQYPAPRVPSATSRT